MSTLASVIGRGVNSSRPAAGIAGELYFSTDVGPNGTLYRDNGSSWDVLQGNATVSQQILGADHTLATANTFDDILTISSAVAGTYLLFATAAVVTSSGQWITAKVYDGSSTVYGSGEAFANTTGEAASIPVLGYVVLGSTGNIKLAVTANIAGGSTVIKAAASVNGAGNNATQLIAVRVA